MSCYIAVVILQNLNMKLAQCLVAILSVILACVVVSSLLVLPNEEALALIDDRVSTQELSSHIPVNPEFSDYPERAFGQFAWETFVALNWPADCGGSPLPNEEIGQAPKAPRVWEFYNFPEQIFLPNGQAPPNPVPPAVPPQCQTANTLNPNLRLGKLRLTESQEVLARASKQELQNNSVVLASGLALVDQSGNYVINGIRINPTEIKQIVDVHNEWYSANNLTKFDNDTQSGNPFALVCSEDGTHKGEFPCKENQDVGAMEIKAAWMVLPDLTPEEIKSKYPNYYTTTRTFFVDEMKSVDGTEKEVKVPVALIGFHIIRKTSHNSWIWATFEHLDNAPDADQLPSSGHYNLYNPQCEENCKPNYPYPKKGPNGHYLWRDQYPHAVMINDDGKVVEQIHSQITRVVPITATATSLNSEWHEKLDKTSVWKNYELIGVQWLRSPAVPYDLSLRGVLPTESNEPSQLLNVTLEPYVQSLKPDKRSCIACHTSAKLPKPNAKTYSDFSFLLRYAQSSPNPTNVE